MAGGSGDVRKVFIFTTAQNYFGLVSEPWDQPLTYSCPEVNNFLDDGNQMLLRVQRADAGVSFSNAVRPPRGPPAWAGPHSSPPLPAWAPPGAGLPGPSVRLPSLGAGPSGSLRGVWPRQAGTGRLRIAENVSCVGY